MAYRDEPDWYVGADGRGLQYADKTGRLRLVVEAEIDPITGGITLPPEIVQAIGDVSGVPERAVATGSGAVVDDAPAIQDAINAFGVPTTATDEVGGHNVITIPRRRYLINSPLFIPVNVSVDFNWAILVPGPALAATGLGFMVYLNAVNTSGAMFTPTTGDNFPEIKRLVVDCPDETPAKVFYGKAKHRIIDCAFNKCSQIYKKEGSTNPEYTDQLSFERINVARAVGSDWLFDIGYHGDAFKFDQVHVYLGSTGTNLNLLRLDRCRGAVIDRAINGNYEFSRCSAIQMNGFHLEFGSIKTRSAQVTLSDGMIWNDANGSDAPIVVDLYDSEPQVAPVVIDNVAVVYPKGRTGLSETAYSAATKPDATINAACYADIRNFTRLDIGMQTSTRGRYKAARVGIVGQSPLTGRWDNVAPLAAKRAVVAGGRVKPSPTSIEIEPAFPTITGYVSSETGWELATSTYYYRVQLIYGATDRRVGLTGNQITLSLTNGAGVPRFIITPVNAPGDSSFVTMRLYRGTSSGQYTHYVDIPVFMTLDVTDMGYHTSTGEAWISRTAGAADTMNAATKMDVIGDRVAIVASATPGVGAWRPGDECVTASGVLRYNGAAWA